METKRLVLAVTLCLGVMLGWQYLSEKMGWITPVPAEQQTEQMQQEQVTTPTVASLPATSLPVFNPTKGREVTVTTPNYTAVLHSNGGVLKSFALKNYRVAIDADAPAIDLVDPDALGLAPLGLVVDGSRTWEDASWSFEGTDLSLTGEESGTLTFVGEMNGMRLMRNITFSANTYVIGEDLVLMDTEGVSRTTRLDFTFGTGQLSGDENRYNLTRVAWFAPDSGFSEETDTDTLEEGMVQNAEPLLWAGVMNNYFLGAIAPADDNVALKARLQQGVYRIGMERSGIAIPANGEASVATAYYLGPKTADGLAKAPNLLNAALDFGMFTVLAEPLLAMLKFFFKYVGNYGVAIILLTIVIKIVFWPLSHKSYKSMEQMKKLQPMMQKVREKYPDDRQRQNQEVMALYKTYKVNPAGGCLPMIVQIPVFFGLYQGLLNAIELRHASFIATLPFTDIPWLADLSASDPFYITPIIMGGTMILQQMFTPSTGDPVQRKMMMFMPIIFTFMFLSFPCGLVIYWLVNNMLSIAQQWLMLRKV